MRMHFTSSPAHHAGRRNYGVAYGLQPSRLRPAAAGHCRSLNQSRRATPALLSTHTHIVHELNSLEGNPMDVRKALGQIRRRLSSTAALCGALLAVASQASAFTCDAIPEIRLNSEQSQLLKTFKRREDSSGNARLTIVLGPALDCITSNAQDCSVTVSASGWNEMASAPGKIDKTTAEAIAEDIERYLFAQKDLNPDVKAFFVCLDKYYTEKSQR